MKPKYFAFLILILSLASPYSTANEESLVRQCQSIKDNIDRYVKLKRKGGSGSQMNNWRKQINNYKNKYIKQDCKRVRARLK